MRSVLFALVLVGAGTTGCSWLIGVSEDPVVVDTPSSGGNDAGDEDAAAVDQ
jgi:hypothetical protein